MDRDSTYSLLNGSAALIAAWHTALDRPMTEEGVKTMYADKPLVLLMDANSAMRWAAHRLARLGEQVHLMSTAREFRGTFAHGAALN